mmetsp:Transcript_40371/g.93641  ORF Transcript_40371/g.93641 Transcript_40371/m.93641 type:complete len:596 (+) Transcript_40371:95-1882(+)
MFLEEQNADLPDSSDIKRSTNSGPSVSKYTSEKQIRSQLSNLQLTDSGARRDLLPQDWSWLRQSAAIVVLNPIFDIGIGCIVLFNIGFIVHQANLSGLKMEQDTTVVWLTFTMLVIYTLEAALRLYVFRLAYFCSGWNILDFVVLLADWSLQTVAFLLVEDVPRTTVLRTLRVLRALRVLRTIRTLELFRELYIMLYGFFSALKAIAWAAVLILLILLIFGIVAVEMIHPLNEELTESGVYVECERCPRAFQTVWASMLTFSQQIVAGDSWGRVTIPIVEAYPLTTPFFVLVFVTVDLGLLNLILSVIVDKAHQAHQEDVKFQMAQRQQEFDRSISTLTDLCSLLDEDQSGCLSLDELLSGYDKLPEFQDQMRRMDMEREDMLSLFKCLDEDQSGDIQYAEFVEQVVKMRSQDTTLSLMFLRSQIKEIKAQTNAMSRDLEVLKRKFGLESSDQPLPPSQPTASSGLRSWSLPQAPAATLVEKQPPPKAVAATVSTQTEDLPPPGVTLHATRHAASAPPGDMASVHSWQQQVREMREALLRLEDDMAVHQDPKTGLTRPAPPQEASGVFTARCCSPVPHRTAGARPGEGPGKFSRV